MVVTPDRTVVSMQRLLAPLLLAATASAGCATVAGTVASPLTGGVDAVMTYGDAEQWYWAPFLFLGGTLGGAPDANVWTI